MTKNNKKSIIGSKAKEFIKPRLSKKSKITADSQADQPIPRITSKTVEEHRKQVIKDGRKYRYPLISTPRKIIGLSVLVASLLMIVFTSVMMLQLYRNNSYSDFTYSFSRAVPVPAARVGGSFVFYDDYLFELRRWVHYFESQREIDFESQEGKELLEQQRQRAIDKVVDDLYIAKLARQKDLSVSAEEVESEIELLRQQNKLGASQSTAEDVLRDFWDWSLDDYRSHVRKELLKRKVFEAYDTSQAKARAEQALQSLKDGADFAELAAQLSEDQASAQNGGSYGYPLNLEERNEDPRVLQAVFETPEGQYSGIINTGYKLEIIKVDEVVDQERIASHISFFFDAADSLNDLKEERPARVYVNLD